MFKISLQPLICFIKIFLNICVNCVLGTYLVQQRKQPMAIDKNTTNYTLEIFSGDVLQFGQGKITFKKTLDF